MWATGKVTLLAAIVLTFVFEHASADCICNCAGAGCVEWRTGGQFNKYQSGDCWYLWILDTDHGWVSGSGSIGDQARVCYGTRLCAPTSARDALASCGDFLPNSEWEPDTCLTSCSNDGTGDVSCISKS
jgi:hypothetical protein